jgi:2-keto-3-deoxy-L-rhamnonate aldolase RhmA
VLRKNLTKEKLKAGKVVVGFHMDFASSFILEHLGPLGFDYVFIDCEHPIGMEQLDVENMIRVAELVNVTPIVRVPMNHPKVIANYLDNGAMGVIIPHCRNKELAEAAVRAAKYPPDGERGIGGRMISIRTQPLDEYCKMANEETMVTGLIEDADAVDNLPEILSVKGIDMIIIGRFDLSLSMGYPGQLDHPVFRKTVDKIVNTAHAMGKPVAVGPAPVKDPEELKRFLKMGVQYIDLSCAAILKEGAQGLLKTVRDIAAGK